MRFEFTAFDHARPVISVDGITAAGPNFSHWPGNRTPPELKADTSTGIALNLAALSPGERVARFGGLDVVANNHFDTDGVFSCLAVLDPELALRHRDVFLAAATTGDFQTFTTEAALAIDLTLTKLGQDDGPFSTELRGASGVARGQRQYEIALAAAPRLVANPFAERALIARELATELADLEFARGPAVAVECDAAASLAVVHSPRPLARLAVNSVARGMVRVLAISPAPASSKDGGWLYRYHDRVESWFEMISMTPPPRRDLAPLAARLNELEGARPPAAWRAQAMDEPVPQVYFGLEGTGRAFGSPAAGDLAGSRLPPALVREELAKALA